MAALAFWERPVLSKYASTRRSTSSWNFLFAANFTMGISVQRRSRDRGRIGNRPEGRKRAEAVTARGGVPHADAVARRTLPDLGLGPQRELVDEIGPRRHQVRTVLRRQARDLVVDRRDRFASSRTARDEASDTH